MTRDDIVRMAQEAAIMPPNWGATEAQWRSLEAFAELVAQAERDRLHDKFMVIHQSQKHSNNYWHFAARKIKDEDDAP